MGRKPKSRRCRRQRSWNPAARREVCDDDGGPAPGAYNPDKPPLFAAPAFTMAGRHAPAAGADTGPAPGQYHVGGGGADAGPAFTLRGKPADPRGAPTPGPGYYGEHAKPFPHPLGEMVAPSILKIMGRAGDNAALLGTGNGPSIAIAAAAAARRVTFVGVRASGPGPSG
jgi:hypothetical protein